MKGIILAGGKGSRLYPLTQVVSKQLLPVYSKPMIYYPLSILMLASIRDILIITNEDEVALYQKLLGDGSTWGIQISYAIQESPDGIAQAFIIGEEFIGDDNVCLILGDNLFYGEGLSAKLKRAVEREIGVTLFAYQVQDPQRFGIVELDKENQAISLEEKPEVPKSNYAVTGLYFYDRQVIELAKELQPSQRGELEITDLNRLYLEKKQVYVETLGRGTVWLDTGTPDSLLEASQFIHAIEKHKGYVVACLEEIAYHNGWIDQPTLQQYGKQMASSFYGKYLLQLAE